MLQINLRLAALRGDDLEKLGWLSIFMFKLTTDDQGGRKKPFLTNKKALELCNLVITVFGRLKGESNVFKAIDIYNKKSSDEQSNPELFLKELCVAFNLVKH